MNWIIFMLILSDLSAKAEIIGMVGAILTIAGGLLHVMCSEIPLNEKQVAYVPMLEKASIVGIFLVTLAVLIPRPNTIYAIVGVEAADIGIEKLQNSEIFTKSLELLNLKLDKALKGER
ncbi:hypothetical protein [Campylobacter sp. RM16192]|uniref:hypothetical protein n=1 Tax=Campylobacter sp. RM16192 TaxID=1660080 RepID=UPI0014515DEE|nr:hypothetical protein [Campylobacter sp. RM16192]QCD52847.1 putative membrane protein [Campylobacter sp. RM16192]